MSFCGLREISRYDLSNGNGYYCILIKDGKPSYPLLLTNIENLDDSFLSEISETSNISLTFQDMMTKEIIKHDITSGYRDMGGSLSMYQIYLIEDISTFKYNNFTAFFQKNM